MHVPSLNMSNIIAHDAPILSPTTTEWDRTPFSPTSTSTLDNYGGLDLQYPLSPTPSHAMSSSSSLQSPVPAAMMLRGRLSPDYSDSEPQMCVPTHQVFDCPAPPAPEPTQERVATPARVSLTVSQPPSTVPAKRPSTSTSGTVKKRATISTKDFVPPDVSGLSKREARLVKNRAAAFLSRQRKREEFENMEVRVAELEQENARLLALANQKSESEGSEELLSEVEKLRRQLAAAQERERELSEELSRKEASRSQPVKMEMVEDSPLPSRSASVQPQMKTGTSLGLMVLLCALPSLLSLPTQSALPTSFSFPLSDSSSLPPSSSSAFDINSFMPGDFEWSLNGGGSIMDLDVDSHGRLSTSTVSTVSTAKRLEFVDVDTEALGLSGLDISFDAQASQDGKIRVRIHPSASAPPTSAPSPESQSDAGGEDQSMWGGSEASGPTSDIPAAFSSSSSSLAGALGSTTFASSATSKAEDQLGPFLGIGGDMDFGSGAGLSHLSGGMSVDSGSSGASMLESGFDFGSAAFASSSSSSSYAGRKRVRIALKSLPGEGAEGGEWEVQLC